LHLKPSIWWGGMKWLFGKSGILRAVVPEWRDFMRADFHPWDANNRELIERWSAAATTA